MRMSVLEKLFVQTDPRDEDLVLKIAELLNE